MKNVKKFLCKPGILLFLALVLTPQLLSAQFYESKRVQKKSFPVGRETTLEVENKYGTILVVPWNKDSVQISVDMFFRAKSPTKLNKLESGIDISFIGTRHYVVARTDFGEGSSRIGTEISALSQTLSNNSEVEINYTVYIPDYINLIINNRYGDIYIDDIHGNIDIYLSNGVLKANSFLSNSTIELVFARGVIRSVGNTTLKLNYGDLEIQEAEQVDLISKSSDLYINKVGILKMESRRDEIGLGEVEYLYGNTSFTDIVIEEFIRESDCYMRYGSIEMKEVMPDFSRINIESDFTDVTLYFEPVCSYRMSLLYSDKAFVYLPGENASLQTYEAGDDFSTTEGYIGNNPADKKLNIKALNKCFIKIARN